MGRGVVTSSTSILILLSIVFINNGLIAQSKSITFVLNVSTQTPEDELVVLHLDNEEQFLEMKNISDNKWSVTTNIYLGATYRYKYCRNYMQAGAEEEWDGRDRGYREKVFTNSMSVVQDTVKKWRWWPIDGSVPNIDIRSHRVSPPNKMPSTAFQCGVELPDFWWPQFGYVIEATLDKIVRETNSNWIQYAPIPEIFQFYPTPIIKKECNNGTPEDALTRIIYEAHKRGLKIFLRPFPWALSVQDISANLHTNEWWIAYEAEWRPIILYYAQVCQKYGVESLAFNMWPNIWQISKPEVPIIDSLSQNLLKDIRSIYKGIICVEYSPFGPDLSIYGLGDNLYFKIWDCWPYRLANSYNPTLDEMIANLRNGIDASLRSGSNRWNKPIILAEIAASSFDGAAHQSYDVEAHAYWNPDDFTVPLDLQEQADVYEVMLEAISEREWITGAYSFNYNYWDSLDKTPSIRAKPAEKVLAKWWRWIHPNLVHLSIASKFGGTADPLPGSYLARKDTTATIVAKPAPGHQFSCWTGDIPLGCDKTNPIYLTMDSDRRIVANFEYIDTNALINNRVTSHFSLSQNYPNPFNPSTTIEFSLQAPEQVSLKFYSISGSEVAELVHDKLPAGTHKAFWNVGDLANGVYYYVLEAGEYREVCKAILIK